MLSREHETESKRLKMKFKMKFNSKIKATTKNSMILIIRAIKIRQAVQSQISLADLQEDIMPDKQLR